MCGITGILSFDSKEIKSEVIHSMNNQQIHRGPDGEGIWINDTSNVGLGHRRLSILDLSERGAQPMHLANNRFSITFNGEIYNYVELKKELLDSGVSFSTETDTEVLLVLYTKYGADCLQKLDGMFAFSIWDDVKKELFCARDRFGEKPFYFYKDSNRFVFASEMKALFAAGVTKSINTERVGGYLKYNAIVDHHDLSSTFYKDIYQLEASNFLLINNSGNVTKTKYWELNNTLNSTPTIKEASVRFRELFEQSVKRRLRADVSVGSSLSGGLDSSSIVRVIDELKNKTQKQKTFSARFKDFDKDEGEYIEAVINRSNVDAHYTWPDGDKFINDLEKVAYHQEEPFQSASISAQWEVMKFAKEHNTNVLMDGQGADEYLAGYHSLILPYLKDLYLKDKAQFKIQHAEYQKLHNKVVPISKTFGLTAKYPIVGKMLNLTKGKNTKSINAIGVNDDLFNTRIPESKAYWQCGSLNEALSFSLFEESLPKLLRYADRNAMAHSVEVRLPFLSHELVEYVAGLPNEYKIQNGWTKFILRKGMEDILPNEITWRKDKIGYVPPQKRWMENTRVKEMVNDSYSFLENEKMLTNRVDGMEWKYIMLFLMMNK